MNKPIFDPFLMLLFAIAVGATGIAIIATTLGGLAALGVLLLMWGNNIARDTKRNREKRYE